MKTIAPIDFADAEKLTPMQLNDIHLETGLHSDAVKAETKV